MHCASSGLIESEWPLTPRTRPKIENRMAESADFLLTRQILKFFLTFLARNWFCPISSLSWRREMNNISPPWSKPPKAPSPLHKRPRKIQAWLYTSTTPFKPQALPRRYSSTMPWNGIPVPPFWPWRPRMRLLTRTAVSTSIWKRWGVLILNLVPMLLSSNQPLIWDSYKLFSFPQAGGPGRKLF